MVIGTLTAKIYRDPKDTLVSINQTRPDFSLFDRQFMRPMGGVFSK